MSANNLANARGWKAKAALSILTLSGITLGAAAIAGNRYTKQRQKLIEKVAPDLRSQILELPLELVPSTALLRLLNKASDKGMPTKFDGEGAISDIKGESPDDGHPFYARKFLPDTPEQGGTKANLAQRCCGSTVAGMSVALSMSMIQRTRGLPMSWTWWSLHRRTARRHNTGSRLILMIATRRCAGCKTMQPNSALIPTALPCAGIAPVVV